MPLPPGSPQAMVPRHEDYIVRRFEELDRKQATDIASMNAAALATSTALAAHQVEIDANVTAIAANVAALAANVAALAARISLTASISTFNTGSLPNDSTFHYYGANIDITIAVPTGKLLVMVGCAEASLNPGGVAVQGMCSFSIPGQVTLGTYQGRNYLASSAGLASSPLILVQSVSVTPGTYTVTGRMGAWTSGTTTASVNFSNPFMTLQVTA